MVLYFEIHILFLYEFIIQLKNNRRFTTRTHKHLSSIKKENALLYCYSYDLCYAYTILLVGIGSPEAVALPYGLLRWALNPMQALPKLRACLG